MSKLAEAAVFALALSLLAACVQQPGSEAVQEFFAKGQIGSSPDFAIIKFGNASDHVITVHGFGDDLSSCMQVSDALNVAACEEIGGDGCLKPYSCRVLN